MEKVECKQCGKKFDTKDALEQHTDAVHVQKTEEKKTVKISTKVLMIYGIIFVIVGSMGYGIFWSLTSKSTVGSIGSTHIHADFAIFLNGKEITPFPPQLFVRSPYIHVESGPGAGSVIHMHAINVPLSMFFSSLGMEFNDKCFIIAGNDKFCNSGDSTLKMFVKHENGNWEMNNQSGNYVFQDLDKILISFGNENDEQLKLQMGNVTDFSRTESQTE